jgi:hypothetical protein
MAGKISEEEERRREARLAVQHATLEATEDFERQLDIEELIDDEKSQGITQNISTAIQGSGVGNERYPAQLLEEPVIQRQDALGGIGEDTLVSFPQNRHGDTVTTEIAAPKEFTGEGILGYRRPGTNTFFG